MNRDWMKSNIAFTLVDADHEKGVKHSFAHVSKEATPETIVAFGKIVEALTGATVKDVYISETDLIASK